MLNELAPEKFNEWMAAYYSIPLGGSWEQAGTVASTIHNEIAPIAAALGSSQFEPLKPADFIPDRFGKEQSPDDQSTESFAVQAEQLWG